MELIYPKMISPQPKTNELLNDLTPYLFSSKRLDQFSSARIKRDASKLPTEIEKHFILGTLSGINYHNEDMIYHFDRILHDSPTGYFLNNYLVITLRNGMFYKSEQLAKIIIDEGFNKRDLVEGALVTFALFGDLERIKICLNTLSTQWGEDYEVSNSIDVIKFFYENALCTKEQLIKLTNIFSQIIIDTKVPIGIAERQSMFNGSYIMQVITDDFDLLADMNFRLAEMVTSESSLDNCKIIARFDPYIEVKSK